MPKPASDLEKYLAGEFAETHDGAAVLIVLVALLLFAVLLWG